MKSVVFKVLLGSKFFVIKEKKLNVTVYSKIFCDAIKNQPHVNILSTAI